jgi:hypothetical protein
MDDNETNFVSVCQAFGINERYPTSSQERIRAEPATAMFPRPPQLCAIFQSLYDRRAIAGLGERPAGFGMRSMTDGTAWESQILRHCEGHEVAGCGRDRRASDGLALRDRRIA